MKKDLSKKLGVWGGALILVAALAACGTAADSAPRSGIAPSSTQAAPSPAATATTTLSPAATATAVLAPTVNATIIPTATPAPAATASPVPTVAAASSPTRTPGGSSTATGAIASNELLARGKLVFEKTAGGVGCATCHGLDGNGKEGTGAPPNRGKNEAQVREALSSVLAMSFIKLTDEEIEAVVAYLEYLNEQP